MSAALFALVVSFASLMNKLVSVYHLPFLVLFFRYLFSFSGSFALQKVGFLHYSYAGKGRRGLLFVNALVYAASHALQIIGLVYAPSILNAILFATVPVWAEILAFFVLKEKASLRQSVLVLISMGCLIAMLVLGQSQAVGAIHPLGFFLLLGSCIMEAVNNILIRFLKADYSPTEISFAASGIALVVCSCILALQCLGTGLSAAQLFAPAKDLSFLLPVLYLGLGCTLASGILKGVALQNMSALKASAWSNVASALSILFGVLLLKETFHSYQIFCSIGIVGSVLGIQAEKQQKTNLQ